MRAAGLGLFCALLMVGNECVYVAPVRVGPPQTGRLTVMAVSPLGDPVPGAPVELTNTASRKVYQAKTGVAIELPLGQYEARLRVPGFFDVRDRFEVLPGDTFVRAEVHFGGMACLGDHFVSVTGTVEGKLAERELWVKLLPVAGSGAREVRVTPHGYFLFDGVEGGRYFLLLVEGSKILHSEALDAFGKGARVDIRLEAGTAHNRGSGVVAE